MSPRREILSYARKPEVLHRRQTPSVRGRLVVLVIVLVPFLVLMWMLILARMLWH